jgi:hypothetical protein
MAAEIVTQLVGAIGSLDGDELQQVLTSVLRDYAARVLADGRAPFPPFSEASPLTPTEALVVAGEILKAAKISSFELASMLNI